MLGNDNDPNRYSGQTDAAQTLTPHSSDRKNNSVVENVLSITSRRKRANNMRRLAPMLKRIRQFAKNQYAPETRLVRRAQRTARKYVKTRYAGSRGANYQHTSLPNKIAVDKIVSNNTTMIKNLTKRLLPSVRKAEYMRQQARRRKETKKHINHAGGLGIMHEDYKVHTSLKNHKSHPSQAAASAVRQRVNALAARAKAKETAKDKPKPKKTGNASPVAKKVAKPKVGSGNHNQHKGNTKPKTKITDTPKRERKPSMNITIHGGTNTIHGVHGLKEGVKYRLKKKQKQFKIMDEEYSSFDPPDRVTTYKRHMKNGGTTTGNKRVRKRDAGDNPRDAYADAYKEKKKPDGIVHEMIGYNDNNTNDNNKIKLHPSNENAHPSIISWMKNNVKKGGHMTTTQGYANYCDHCFENDHIPLELPAWNNQFLDASGHEKAKVNKLLVHKGVSLKNLHESNDKKNLPPPLPVIKKDIPPPPPAKKRPFSNLIDQHLANRRLPPPLPVEKKKFANLFKKINEAIKKK